MIGVLLLDNTHLHGHGAMACATSYPVEVMFLTLDGVHGRALIDSPTGAHVAAFMRGAARLARQGAGLVVTNCGFAMSMQTRVARAVPVPVALSALILLPALQASYGGRVAVLTYDAAALQRAWRGFGLGQLPPHAGVAQCPHWHVLEREMAVEPDLDRMESELEVVALRLAHAAEPRALLLECTGMLPFAERLQERTGLPVFGIFHLIRTLLGVRREQRMQND